ncbi:right-handed parallel beta-helix repeat-containing protein [Cohnella sp. CFH 77786]|uniref:right-handed parallel beta-helix repeat-containing protein n=1 Tax=Cohnella sp. CFH 77786 TaxID=2662265 RepID=UPI001C61074C|nr:right-handed parallel beta-helix repeat-containing protein [Cohnella sp. CFH 77786]
MTIKIGLINVNARTALKFGLVVLAALLFASLPHNSSETEPIPPRITELKAGPDPGREARALPAWGPERETPSLRVSVKSYGAKGDGKSDDTAAIQAAVNKVGKSGGGVVFFPNGVYKVSDSIVVSHDRVTLEGQSWGAELRMVKHPKRIIVIEGSWDNTVKNLKLTLGLSNVTRHDQDFGIYVTNGASHFLIERIFGNGKGIMVRGNVATGTIRDNRIQNTLADGIHLTGGARYILVTGNELSNTGDDSIAVVSYQSQKVLTKQIVIAGNTVRNSRSRGIAHVGGYQVEIRDNRIQGTASSGILVDRDNNYQTYSPVNTLIEGNTVTGAGTYGLKGGNQFGIEVSKGAAYVTITDNTVNGSKSRGISVAANRTIIRNNVSSNNEDSGMTVTANDVVIAGNLLEKNGMYGFVAENSDRLRISGNRIADNNTRKISHIDNFLLKDSESSRVTGNVSVETRADNQVERAFELTGSCRSTVFENNQSQGTRLGTAVECKP